MTEQDVKIDELFDRAWRVPWRAKSAAHWRRILLLLLLTVMVAIIAGYWYITDADRVRGMAQTYLSELVGGQVTIEKASLSIFEGLRLENVTVKSVELQDEQAQLFQARSLQVQYSPAALAMGRIEATRILAIDPRVSLCEDLDQHRWNFERLNKRTQAVPTPKPSTRPTRMMLPEISLRNARVEYSQVVHGSHSPLGNMTIEGQLTPDQDSLYRFNLQSRGTSGAVGPVADGWVSLGGQGFELDVRGVEFVKDLKMILGAQIRNFWEEHELAGRIGQTRIKWKSSSDFAVEIDLDGVGMVFHPDNWTSAADRRRREHGRDALRLLQDPSLGRSRIAPLVDQLITPSDIHLDEVDGTFVFTRDKVALQDVVARVENNRFKITGAINGYDQPAKASAKIRIESLATENIFIPDSPTYITAMPPQVREIYYRFRPRGAASLWVELTRDPTKDRPQIAGEVAIHDARFVFDRFPYPIERANGKIEFGTDEKTGIEMMRVSSIRGHGATGSINENATLDVSGTITPLGDDAGADIVVKAYDIQCEHALIAAMPPLTKKTVKSFDPDNTGKFPRFRGDVVCTIHRPIGIDQPWTIDTALELRETAGRIKVFPYPLEDVQAKLVVHDDFIELVEVKMNRHGADLRLTGKVDWGKHLPGEKEPLIQPDITVHATNVPLDEDLISALPASKQKWLRNLKLGGHIDLDGKIGVTGPMTEESTEDFTITTKDASTVIGQCKVEGISAKMRLSSTGLSIENIAGHRGDSKMAARATIDWSKGDPTVTARARVTGVEFDSEVLSTVPTVAAEVIRDLKPVGKVDVDLEYSGIPGGDASQEGYRVAITAADIALTPPVMAVQVEKIKGQVIVEPNRVSLVDLAGSRQGATIKVSGDVRTDKPQFWDLNINCAGIAIDDELHKALPVALRKLADSLTLKGKYNVDLPKLTIRPVEPLPTDPKQKVNTVTTMSGAISTVGGQMNAGVALTDITGQVKISARMKNDSLDEFSGDLAFESVKIAGRSANEVTAMLVKPAGKDMFQIGKLQGKIADGQISGQIDTTLEDARSRFGLNLILRNAKVSDLAGDTDKPIEGRLTASLLMEGVWNDNTTRRGRGDVTVDGKEMYRVPVIFGWMQIANLSLPHDAPIQQAGVRYSVEGNRVTLEQIDLRSPATTMQGNGWLDFKDKTMRMSLSVASSPADKVPLFGPLLQGVREDLTQIQIRGTLQEPKVGATIFNAFNTTIDEVIRGDKK